MSIKKLLSFSVDGATKSFAWGMGATTSLVLMLLVLGSCLSPDGEKTLTLIVCLTAYVLGVPLGMLVSPHKDEGKNFQKIGSYLITFISGYVVSKFAGINVGKLIADSVGNSLRSGRMMLFVSFFVLGVVQTYILRAYRDKSRELAEVGKQTAGHAGP